MNGVVTHFAQHRAPYIRPPGEKLEVDALPWTLSCGRSPVDALELAAPIQPQ